MEIKSLTDEQVREILTRYYPGEAWEQDDEEDRRLALVERATPNGETCTDNEGQSVRYTGIV